MDIGQDNFDAIAGLVAVGDIRDAKVVSVPDCRIIDVAVPGEYYRFDWHDKSVTLNVGQCQAISAEHEPYLKAIRQIVRNVSDRQTLVVRGKCIRF